VVFAIVKGCQFVVSVQKQIAVQEKVSVKQLQVKRKQLRNKLLANSDELLAFTIDLEILNQYQIAS
jgi:hypothetical protein